MQLKQGHHSRKMEQLSQQLVFIADFLLSWIKN